LGNNGAELSGLQVQIDGGPLRLSYILSQPDGILPTGLSLRVALDPARKALNRSGARINAEEQQSGFADAEVFLDIHDRLLGMGIKRPCNFER
jgi:methylphosphotriester-DNA--protein-cysteine methyltransferase